MSAIADKNLKQNYRLAIAPFIVIYCFGIKGGIRADSLSIFFHLLRLEKRIGCSASALRKLEVQIKEKIIAYGTSQKESWQGDRLVNLSLIRLNSG